MKNNKKTEDYVKPLLVLFFVFLVLVQGISFYLQTEETLVEYHNSIDNTQTHYAMQAGMTSRSLLEVTELIAQRHASSLLVISQNRAESDAAIAKLSLALEQNVQSQVQDFLVYDLAGSLKFANQRVMTQVGELAYLKQSIDAFRLNLSNKPPIFVSPNRNLYSLVEIRDSQQAYGYFLLRQSFSAYTDALNSAYSPGFSLALIDTKRQKWLADESGILFDESPKNLIDHGGLAIEHTNWQVVVVEDKRYLFWKIVKPLYAKLLFLAAYIFLAIWSVRFIRYMQRSHVKSLALAAEKSERAEQALSCIEEIVITTDLSGRIIYSNKAEKWLTPNGKSLKVGEYLPQQLPLRDAGWMNAIDLDTLLGSAAQTQELMVDVNGRVSTLELSHKLLKKDKKNLGIVWVLRDISSQVADRELLEESRTRYRALYEGAGVGMWHVDIALVRAWLAQLNGECVKQYLKANPQEVSVLVSMFELIDMNEAAHELHGTHNIEALQSSIHEIFSGGNEELIIATAAAIQKGKQQISLEARVKRLDGSVHHFVVSISLDSVGVDQALISFIDITDRIEAEQALKDSERFWSEVLQALPDTVYVNDLLEKRTVYSSRHVSELLGYEKEEARQFKHWRELVQPCDKDKVTESLSQLRYMKLGDVLETQLRMQHKDGGERTLRFRDRVFTTDDHGVPKYYVGIGRDVTEEENAKRQLAFNERQYRLLAEGISDIVISLDTHLKLTFVSPSVQKILGIKPEDVLHKGLSLIFTSESMSQMHILARKDLHDATLGQAKYEDHKVRSLDLHARTVSGKDVVLEVQSSIMRSEHGDIEGILAIGRDVTQRRRIEQEVRTAAEVFENSSEAIVVTDTRGCIQQVNRAFTHMTGYTLAELRQREPLGFLAPDLLPQDIEAIHESLVQNGYWQGELSYRNRQGQTRPSWTGVTALRDKFGRLQSHIAISSDITDRKVSEARIQRLAYYDPLTGLPNRQQMHETLERVMAEQHESVVLLFIDLDRFKPINDTMGHPVGDRVLKEVALRLRAAIRKQDLVARIGGDEFTVIMPGFSGSQQASEEAIEGSERILHQLLQPFVIEDQNLYLSASIGVALYPQDAVNGTDLLRNADTAMYHAKAMGKNNFQFYAEEMNIKALQRLEMENHLHQALRQGEFELYYQPQWDTARNCLCGIEALLRCHPPDPGLVGPDLFIPIIEETGLIVPVGEWVLRAACEQIIEWQEAGLDVPTVAVNISARQFKDEQMLDRICRIVDETGVDPELIELELTESILMDDVERTLAVLHETRRMGFHISIDDFGTGYSSLSYLKQFPVDNLKVDASFIRNLPMNQEDGQITRTIVAMATNLGLGVIAEGVETQAQQDFLQDVGCYRVQGFRYSRPVTAEQLSQQFLDHEAEVEFELEAPLPA